MKRSALTPKRLKWEIRQLGFIQYCMLFRAKHAPKGEFENKEIRQHCKLVLSFLDDVSAVLSDQGISVKEG